MTVYIVKVIYSKVIEWFQYKNLTKRKCTQLFKDSPLVVDKTL